MKVSVIIPVYNVSDYIERCIRSVMNQTYSDIECIIVDDATPDDSIVKSERMIAAYHGPIRFSILHHQKNRGLSAARNTGTDAATGEYIYYLDSDDEIIVDCIEKLIQPMIEDDTIEMVQGMHLDEKDGYEYIFHEQKYPITIKNNEEVYQEYYKSQNLMSLAWNKLIKRSFLISNNLYFREGLLHEDILWFFYVKKYLNKVFLSTAITYIYHRRHTSITMLGLRNMGNCYLVINQDIFNNLTAGREKIELRGSLRGFCEAYCAYSNEVPAFKDTYRLYLQQARRNGCWYVFSVLIVVGFVRIFCNPMSIMKLFRTIRWRLMELPDILFKTNSK